MSILRVEDLAISFGGVTALDEVSFTVEPGAIFAVIGPNGAGKTTLFNVMSGIYAPARGRVLLDGDEITRRQPHEIARRGLSRTFQNLQVFFRMTALENVMVGCHRHERRNVLSHFLTLPSVLAQNRDTRRTAEALLAFVGIESAAERPAGTLPYGVLKRLEIARALATQPRVLLLDEPAAGCNPTETAEIDAAIQKIAASGIAVVLVEHDMRLVMKISSRIHVLHQGRSLVEGSRAEVGANPEVIAAYLGAQGVREAKRAER
jgi:branched-chain amino acid transport system ATP-binding protein